MSAPRRVVVEADGGSRGNPGDAAYGAVLKDADTGAVIAERGEYIGRATNNVAEYRGLIAGLELVREHAPDADVEVRMDSKLVVEQMARRWKVKHPAMIPLFAEATQIAPFGVTWTWVPRAQNAHADALANVALDEAQGKPARAKPAGAKPAGTRNPMLGWRDAVADPPTTLVLLRHGVTDSTVNKLFCGRGGADPSLNAAGRAQAARAAAYLRRHLDVDVVVSSPLRRARETAYQVADAFGVEVVDEPGVVEASFGRWDGLTFAEVRERWPDDLDGWLHDTSSAPHGGDSYDEVWERATEARERLVRAHAGRTVVVASHVTPIKMLVREALGAPMDLIHRVQLAPASLSTVQWWSDGTPAMTGFSYVPE